MGFKRNGFISTMKKTLKLVRFLQTPKQGRRCSRRVARLWQLVRIFIIFYIFIFFNIL
jgi:hypothetical protein